MWCRKRLTLSDVRLQHAAEEQQDPQYVSSHGNLRSLSIDSIDRCVCKKRKTKICRSEGTTERCSDITFARLNIFLISSRAVGIKFISIYRIRGNSISCIRNISYSASGNHYGVFIALRQGMFHPIRRFYARCHALLPFVKIL